MKQLVWVVIAVAACGDGGSAKPDAMGDAPTMCAPKMAPLAAGMHKVYLNFDGVTLTKGNDDSAANISSVLMNDPSVIPMWQPALSASTRQGRIDAIVDYVQRALAPYSVDVVTTRPTSGLYTMHVIGGRSQDLGYQPGVAGISAQKCSPLYNGVTLIFDIDAFTATDYATSVLSDVGLMAGMGVSSRHNDCLNRTSSVDPGLVCSFDSMSTTIAPNDCGRTPTQDEPKLLMDAFGCRN